MKTQGKQLVHIGMETYLIDEIDNEVSELKKDFPLMNRSEWVRLACLEKLGIIKNKDEYEN